MRAGAQHVGALFIWLSIIGVSLTSFLTRGSFILFASRIHLPMIVDRALGYAPACALAAIIVPDLAFVHGALRLDVGNPRLIAALIASIGYAASRSLIVTIVCGMASFTAIRIWL